MATKKPLANYAGTTKELSDGDTISGASISNVPSGNIAATTVQDAINELDAEKAKLAGDSAQSFAVNALSIAGGAINTGTGTVATLGTELTTNGSFTGDASGWTLGTNWAYGSNNIVLTNSGSSGTVSQSISITSGLQYLVSWTQTNSIDQNCHITPSIGSVSGTRSAQGTGASKMSQIITAGATGSVALTFTVSDITNTGTVTIDDVSVKQITGYAAHETIKFNSGDANPTEIRHTWDSVHQPSLAIGWHAGYLNIAGHDNSFMGAGAGANNTIGNYNSFFGAGAGNANTNGTGNCFVGANAGMVNTAGSYNSFMGTSAGMANTTGYSNNFIGYGAGRFNTTGCYNNFVGLQAGFLNTTGNYNTFIGFNTGHSNTTGSNNNFIGVNAGYYNTTGSVNNFIGVNAGIKNTTGNYNTFMGLSAGYSNTTGGYNNFIGGNAGYSNTTGNYNNFVGANAGYSNTTGSYNNCMGENAGYNSTTANYNNFMGVNAGLSNTTGDYNCGVGANAGYSNTTGYNNTFVGAQSGYGSSTNANVDGYNNTFIGYGAVGASSSSNNTITLGNSDITTLRCQVTSITALSDRRDKDNIEALPNGLDFINTLNPVKFTWNMRDGAKVGVPDCGFIAQDLKAAQESAGAKDWLKLVLEDNPDKLEITPGRLIPVLVKAIQELSAQVDVLKSQLEIK